ncbi:MAG: archaemetzincin [Candidatus Acidiferrum sp.]
MNGIQLLPFGSVPAELLAELGKGLTREFAVPCQILPPEASPRFAFNVTRQQYLSTEILASMITRRPAETWRLLGVTLVDLYIPILTFVFGEAQLQGNCALVSAHRLRQEFYGLPSNSTLFRERLLKEAAHELGHTLALSHCDDYQCVMSASHGVEWIDLKTSRFCSACRSVVNGRGTIEAAH